MSYTGKTASLCWIEAQGLALLTLSQDKNWDSHSLVNGYPSFYPRIALVAPGPGVLSLTRPAAGIVMITKFDMIFQVSMAIKFFNMFSWSNASFKMAGKTHKISGCFKLLTLKHRETHGCVVSTVATDALVLKHQAISILSTD